MGYYEANLESEKIVLNNVNNKKPFDGNSFSVSPESKGSNMKSSKVSFGSLNPQLEEFNLNL